MTKPKLADPAPLKTQAAYALRGITYLPHYRTRGLFAGPGISGRDLPADAFYKESDLITAGACRIEIDLLVRVAK